MLTIPVCCCLCHMPLRLPQHGICSACIKLLPRARKICPRCGLPAYNTKQDCGRCLKQDPPWQRLIFVTGYLAPLRDQVLRLKFARSTARARMLARLMLLAWLTARREQYLCQPDLLLTVPLHRWRAWQRGYNQLNTMAKILSRWTGADWHSGGIRRIRAGKVQHLQNAAARRRNLRGAFRLDIDVRGCHIALFDDVVTTGSTITELSRLIMQAGAASIQIWCLCRTL